MAYTITPKPGVCLICEIRKPLKRQMACGPCIKEARKDGLTRKMKGIGRVLDL